MGSKIDYKNNKTSRKVIFYLLIIIIYATGIFTGAILDRKYSEKKHYEQRSKFSDKLFGSSPKERSNIIKSFLVEKMTQRLSLNTNQKEQVREILDENEGEFLIIRKRIIKDLKVLKMKVDGEILEILNEKQKEEYNKMMGNMNGDISSDDSK